MELIEKEYGTIVHIDTKENVQAAMSLIPKGIRYFGYVNATEELVPISLNYMPDIHPKVCGVYPHITLSSLQNNKELNDYVKMIGKGIEVKLCDVTRTPNTMAYSAQIKGKALSISKKEMVHKIPDATFTLTAFPIWM